MHAYRFISLLVLLVTGVTSFQATSPLNSLTTSSSRYSNNHIALFEGGEENDKGEGKELTDLDKATFEIAKEYAKTGLPDDANQGGPDGFSM